MWGRGVGRIKWKGIPPNSKKKKKLQWGKGIYTNILRTASRVGGGKEKLGEKRRGLLTKNSSSWGSPKKPRPVLKFEALR